MNSNLLKGNNSNLQPLNRFQSKASLGNGAIVPAVATSTQSNLFDSALVKKSNHNVVQNQFKTSSHVNLGEITQYNAQQRTKRQRPQTGKIRNLNLIGSTQFSQQPQPPFKVIGQLQQQFNTRQHRRLTSATTRATRNQGGIVGGGGLHHRQQTQSGADFCALTNTRDVIQSFGHLTTMAGTNYEPQSLQAALPPPHPMTRQNFMQTTKASKRLQSAKQQTGANNCTALIVMNHQRLGSGSMRPKSGVVTRQRPSTAVQHRRLQSGKVRTSYNQDFQAVQHLNQQSIPDAFGQEMVQTDQDPINLAIDSGHMVIENNNLPSTSANASQVKPGKKAHNSVGKQSHASKSNSRPNSSSNNRGTGLNKTVYRLPSLSQCIENKILPRNSQYMRRLYSIALRNHENQVPKMAPRKPGLNNTNGLGEGATEMIIRPDPRDVPTQNNGNLNNEQAQNEDPASFLLKNKDINADDIAGLQLGQVDVIKKQVEEANLKHKNTRSQSFATLKVKNLQFPFDYDTHGGFSFAKQQELKLGPNRALNEDIVPEKQPGSPGKRRPKTAGRIRMHGMDLFNNQLISQQAANQMSMPALMPHQNEMTTSEYDQQNEQSQVNYPDSHNERSDQDQLNLYQMGNSTSENFTGGPGAQFANLMDQVNQGKALIVSVKPQSTDDNIEIDQQNQLGKKQYAEVVSSLPLSALQQNSGPNNMMAQLNGDYEDEGEGEISRSAARRHSMTDTPAKDTMSGTFYNMPGKNLTVQQQQQINAQSNRDFIPVHYQEKNGTQLVVQMNEQGLTAKRLKSVGHQNSNSQGSGTGRSGKRSSRKVSKRKPPYGQMSSTHSLQINMAQNNVVKDSEVESMNGTNRLEESVINIDDHGGRVLKKSGDKRRHSDSNPNSYHKASEGSFLSNQDLQHHIDEGGNLRSHHGKPIRQVVNSQDKQISYTIEESPHVSLHSHSHTQVDPQMRLKQVYQDNGSIRKGMPEMIHRIPLPPENGSSGPSLSSPCAVSSRQQVLLVTSDPKKQGKVVYQPQNPDDNKSTMSNPLNQFQLSAEPAERTENFKYIKVKSIVFDEFGGHQVREVERGYSLMEQGTQQSAAQYDPVCSPNGTQMLNNSKVYNQQYSPSQRRNSGTYRTSPTAGLAAFDIAEAHQNVVDDKQDFFQSHKQFKVTMQAKRGPAQGNQATQQSRNQATANSTSSQQRAGGNAALKGKRMRLQSAQLRNQQPIQPRKAPTIVVAAHIDQNDLFIDLVKQQNEQLLNESVLQGGLHENSKATVHNVPLLALPYNVCDTATEMLQPSRMPSSNRGNQLSYSQGSFVKIKQLQQQESQKMLNSFNAANNARSNYNQKGPVGSLPSQNKYLTTHQGLQLNKHATHGPTDSRRSLERLLMGNGDEMIVSNRDFSATLPKDKSVASRSERDYEPISALNPKLEEFHENGLPECKVATTPSLVNVDKMTEGLVIQEIEEGSSNASKSKMSPSGMTSFRNRTGSAQTAQHGGEPPRNSTDNPAVAIIQKNFCSSGKHQKLISKTSNQQQNGSAIKSVYEVEDAALRSGNTKTYSGTRREQAQFTNQDLEHFLNYDQPVKEDNASLRNSKNSNQSLDKIKQSKTLKTQKQRSIEQRSKENYTASQISAAQQQSTFSFKIMPFAQKKILEVRPRSMSPHEQQKKPTLESHQQRAHEILEQAKKLMNDQKKMKLDPEAVNLELLQLFSDKQQTKQLDDMMNKVTQDFSTQTISTGKRVRGLEIPFQISNPGLKQTKNKHYLRETGVGSIMTNELSTPQLDVHTSDHKQNQPNFVVGSPHSLGSTVQGENPRASQPAFTFAINSLGGSTNRYSKLDLPFFGGVVSSRIGEVLESGQSLNPLKEIHNDGGSGFENHIVSPSGAGSQGKFAAPVIDYSQNIMIDPNQNNFKKGVTDNAQPAKQQQRKHLRKKRPQTSGTRYMKNSNNILSQDFSALTKNNSFVAEKVKQETSVVPYQQQECNNEHPEQPNWATRNNLKSKFNLMSSQQQAKQAQKFFINDSKKKQNQFEQIKQGIKLQFQRLKSTPIELQPTTIGEVEIVQNNGKRSASLLKKVMSMPCESGSQNVTASLLALTHDAPPIRMKKPKIVEQQQEEREICQQNNELYQDAQNSKIISQQSRIQMELQSQFVQHEFVNSIEVNSIENRENIGVNSLMSVKSRPTATITSKQNSSIEQISQQKQFQVQNQ